MKLSAVGGARRDFWDLHRMLGARSMSLAEARRLFELKFHAVDFGSDLQTRVLALAE